MAKPSSVLPVRLSPWILMLLVWNIVLLSIAIFYLFRITQEPPASQEIADLCAEALLSSSPSL